ncbi:Cytoplasmic 60S subunit biogenesis factor [Podosphaera aphanis]|nr:Cytoplasmic 60S subunit biogenesis factor [Podosphaera aphanis]
MRSDWHRFNLKRRVASLPPIASDVFTEKVLQANVSVAAAATKAAFEKTCAVCTRTYFSHNAYENHLGSLKHKANIASQANHENETRSVISSTFSLGESVNTINDVILDEIDPIIDIVKAVNKTTLEELPQSKLQSKRIPQEKENSSTKPLSDITEGSEPLDSIPVERCLFCNLISESVEANVTHMEKSHGMFIPEKPFLVNIDGLISSLCQKIYEYHECLYCGKIKPSVFGLQTHMRDKGHCMIPFFTEGEQLEIGEFYDFSSTYSDTEDFSDSEDSSINRAPKPGSRRNIKFESVGQEDMVDNEGWETDSSTSSVDSARTTTAYSHGNKTGRAVLHTEYELYLPSGRTAGHRSMNKYYKQNLHNHPSPAERQEQFAIQAAASCDEEGQEDDLANNEPGRSRALINRARGELGMIGVAAHKRREVTALEKRTRRAEDRGRRRNEWLVNKQNNSQKHFRDPLLQ